MVAFWRIYAAIPIIRGMSAPLINQILDRAPNAVVSMDESGRVTYWNPRAEEMFGVSREDALGERVAELIVPERFRAAHARRVASVSSPTARVR